MINLLLCRFRTSRTNSFSILIDAKFIAETKISLNEVINILNPTSVTHSKKDKSYLTFVQNPKHGLKLLRATLEVINQHYPCFFERVKLYNWFSLFRNVINLEYPDFLKYAKYFTAYPYAKTLAQEIEDPPNDNPWLFTGKIRSMLIKRTLSPHKNQVHFWWSWLQGIKRGCEQAEESYIKLSYLKHQAALGKPSTFVPTMEHINKSFELTKHFGKIFRPSLHQFSTGACFENSRSRGGTVAKILEEQYTLSSNQTEVPSSFYHEFLYMYDWKGKTYTIYGLPSPGISSLAGLCKFNPHKNVKVQAILEPLKVRMVTKGNCYSYSMSKFYQKRMWEYLFNFRQFKCIGEPLSTIHLYDMLDLEKYNNMSDLTHFVSGDYSAATDNLSINFTKIIFEAFLNISDLAEGMNDILRSVLYEQTLYYPSDMDLDVLEVQQRNGQLMGSTLSFPILCVANLICYWISIEKYYNRKFEFYELPVLVNGDDILFRSNVLHYEIWKEEIRKVGFQLSIGKNYFDSKYLTINSRLFSYNGTGFEEICYYNTGLLTGQSKLGAYDKLVNLRVAYDCTMQGAINKLLAHHKFIFYNQEMLQEHKHINLFIPEALGGLGCTLYDEVRPYVHITSFQRCMARAALDYEGSFGFIQKNEYNTFGYTKDHHYDHPRWLPLVGPLNEFERYCSNSGSTVLNSNFISGNDTIFRMIPRNIINNYKPISWSDESIFNFAFKRGYKTGFYKETWEYLHPDV